MPARSRLALIVTLFVVFGLSACVEEAPSLETEPTQPATQEQRLEYGGVGIELSVGHGGVWITGVAGDSPAAEAELAVHDQIVAIDGVPTEGLASDAVVELARGPVGSRVEYELLGPDGATRTAVLRRVARSMTEGQYYAELRADREFGGVGLVLEESDAGAITIHEAVEGLPAERAGARPGERIVAVNGRSLSGQPIEVYLDHIRGTPGTSVTLELADESGAVRSVAVERTSIALPERTRCRRR